MNKTKTKPKKKVWLSQANPVIPFSPNKNEKAKAADGM